MAKKNETVDLNTFSEFMGLANTLSRAKKRSLPRGWIKPVTWNTQFKIVENHIEDWGYEVELRPGTHDRVELGDWVADITTTQKKAGRIAAKNRKTPSRKAKI